MTYERHALPGCTYKMQSIHHGVKVFGNIVCSAEAKNMYRVPKLLIGRGEMEKGVPTVCTKYNEKQQQGFV